VYTQTHSHCRVWKFANLDVWIPTCLDCTFYLYLTFHGWFRRIGMDLLASASTCTILLLLFSSLSVHSTCLSLGEVDCSLTLNRVLYRMLFVFYKNNSFLCFPAVLCLCRCCYCLVSSWTEIGILHCNWVRISDVGFRDGVFGPEISNIEYINCCYLVPSV
jgi:hypothetical protein